MTSCAYCGKETKNDQFFCASCSGKSTLKEEKPSLTISSKSKTHSSIQEISLEDDREASLENWQEQELHPDFKDLSLTRTGLFIGLALSVLLGLFQIHIALALTGAALVMAFLVMIRVELTWCRKASSVYSRDNWSELYIFFKNPVQGKGKPTVHVYDEDNMFPDFVGEEAFKVRHGKPEKLGYKPDEPETLVPCKARIYDDEEIRTVIFEASGQRLWCDF